MKKGDKEINLKHRARRYSIKEGIFSSIKGSFGDSYLSPFAIALNSSSSLVALLTSVQGILSPITQIFSSKLIEKHPRKKVVLFGVFFEALIWIPFILLAFLFYKGILISEIPLILLFFFAIYIILIGITTPAWFSWMGDIVDDNYRGRWFAKRNLLAGFVSVIFVIIAAKILDFFTDNDQKMFGFMTLFFIAFLSRMNSWRLLHKQYEPKIKLKKENNHSFSSFLLNINKNNFGKFSLFAAALNFSQAIASSLITVYLLRELELGYVLYMIIILSATVYSLSVIEIWGKFSDKYGNYRVLLLSSSIIPLVPILFIVSESPIYLILIPQLIAGISWSGFNLSSVNFIYDNIEKEKRSLAISHYNLLNGIGIFLGGLTGAFLISVIKTTTLKPIIIIFLISGLARIISVLVFLPRVKEVRKTQKIKSSRALKHILFKESKQTFSEEIHQIMTIKKYLRE